MRGQVSLGQHAPSRLDAATLTELWLLAALVVQPALVSDGTYTLVCSLVEEAFAHAAKSRAAASPGGLACAVAESVRAPPPQPGGWPERT